MVLFQRHRPLHKTQPQINPSPTPQLPPLPPLCRQLDRVRATEGLPGYTAGFGPDFPNNVLSQLGAIIWCAQSIICERYLRMEMELLSC